MTDDDRETPTPWPGRELTMKMAMVASLMLVGGASVLAINYDVGCSRMDSGTICTGIAGLAFVIAAGGILLAGILAILREAADPMLARAVIGAAIVALLATLAGQMIVSLVGAIAAGVGIQLLVWRTRPANVSAIRARRTS